MKAKKKQRKEKEIRFGSCRKNGEGIGAFRECGGKERGKRVSVGRCLPGSQREPGRAGSESLDGMTFLIPRTGASETVKKKTAEKHVEVIKSLYEKKKGGGRLRNADIKECQGPKKQPATE